MTNITKGTYKVQLAGITNYLAGESRGIALAGFEQRHKWKFPKGVQFAGLLNTSKDITGLQFAGLLNIAGKVRGVQFAGL